MKGMGGIMKLDIQELYTGSFAIVETEGTPVEVARVNNDGSKTAEEYARLMASAPELLEALEAVLKVLNDLPTVDVEDYLAASAADSMAQKVIAKAKGEQQ